MPDAFSSLAFLEQLSYLGIFVSVFVAGYIVPIPEELLLLAIGYFSSAGYFNVYTAAVVAFLAILVSDNLLFLLVKRGSHHIEPFLAKIENSYIGKKLAITKNHVGKTVFIARFAIGMRFLGPTLAGLARASWKKFFFSNLIALVVYVPLFTFLGFKFHESLSQIITRLEDAKHGIFVLALIILGLIIVGFARHMLNRNSNRE